jgi:hypothetical protein
MSRVPIPKHLLEKASTPSFYRVFASLNVSLGTAIGPVAGSARPISGSKTSGGFAALKSKPTCDNEQAFGAFQFFGNTVSSAKVDLRLAQSETCGISGGGAGCAGAIGGGRWSGDASRGRHTTLCRLDFEKACHLALHSRQPLKNLNLVAELIVTVTNATGDAVLCQEPICWTIMPLTYVYVSICLSILSVRLAGCLSGCL